MNGILDLYGLLVENVFGGVALAILGFLVILVIIQAISRMSFQLIMVINLSFLFISAVYYAWWSSAFIVIFVLLYFFSSIIKLWSGGQ